MKFTMSAEIQNRCNVWLEKAVIGLNLCPFAKAVHVKGRIRWVLLEGVDEAELRACIEAEMQMLADLPCEVTDTTLIVLTQALPEFLEFHWFVEALGPLLKRLGLRGILQVASFHPHFEFAGSQPHDRANFTNRSPWPIVHLLRESSVEKAVAAFPQAQAIFESNIERLDAMSDTDFKEIFTNAREASGFIPGLRARTA